VHEGSVRQSGPSANGKGFGEQRGVDSTIHRASESQEGR
jgi:hypothetical protein